MRRPKTSFQRCCGKTGVVKDAGDQHNCPPQVGFSGVLFSWIVVAAVELPSFCVFGSACFATRDMRGVRFNIAPFALAAAIQLFLPRASLLGHAAGIVVGYPLAWRLLDSLTPPTIGTILAIIDSMLLDGGTFQQALRPCSCASAMLQAASGLHLWHGGFALSLVIPVEAAALTTIACASRASVSTTALFVVVMHALSMATLAGSLTSDPQLSIIVRIQPLTWILTFSIGRYFSPHSPACCRIACRGLASLSGNCR